MQKILDQFNKLKELSFLRFENREKAAHILSLILENCVKNYSKHEILVLGIPRGGVIIADVLARKMRVKFDILMPRRLIAPFSEELAIGSIIDTENIYLNKKIINSLNISTEYLEKEKQRQLQKINIQISLYLGNKENYIINRNTVKEKIIILVDDGAATGASLLVASRWIKKQCPKKLIVGLIVAPKSTIEILRKETDYLKANIISSDNNFKTVGSFYQNFASIDEEQIVTILKNKAV